MHPAVVHFPIVLMFLLPISAAVAIWAIRRGTVVRHAWAVPVAVAAALTLSAWVSLQTGQQQAEAVEERVAERIIETHEEAAELFLVLSGAVLVLTGAGFLRNRASGTVRSIAAIASVGLIFAGYRVGHSGGELVYKHGAVAAVTRSTADAPAGGATSAPGAATGEREETERVERREVRR